MGKKSKSHFALEFPYPSQRMPVFAHNVVATSQPLAAQAGLEMMRKGGNAVDAALAAAIALTVVEPSANGIGSDAFAMVSDGRKLHGLNGSGRSPREWSIERFEKYQEMPALGWDSVTVPGAVDAWWTLSQRFGRLPFDDLFTPAIHYAKNGFIVTPVVASIWAETPMRFKDFPEFRRVFLPEGRPPRAGERIRFPLHADTLKKIAASRGKDFYQGEIARQIAESAAAADAGLSLEDLAAHSSEWVQPISLKYRSLGVHELPPNGQGLAVLIALGILEAWDVDTFPMDSADSVHLQAEAMKMGFLEIQHHLSDPATMRVKPEEMLEPKKLAETAAEIRMDRTIGLKPALRFDKGTVLVTAADQSGMMVALIQSNYMGFGSGIVIPETGISMQNRGNGFVLKKNHPNCVAGGKRPFHTIIPALVSDERGSLMCFGVMGGHMQPQGHVQMVLRMFDHGLNPQAASDAPRWCLMEDFRLALEPGFAPAVIEDLRRRGHTVVTDAPQRLFGGAQVIVRLEEGYCAASDHRKDGQAVGF
jgi:gamma-glutamyltranspeptidase/glutathione hydrolase